MRFGAIPSARGLATKKNDLLPPLKVAVTGAAGQIGYGLVMRIARYVVRIFLCLTVSRCIHDRLYGLV